MTLIDILIWKPFTPFLHRENKRHQVTYIFYNMLENLDVWGVLCHCQTGAQFCCIAAIGSCVVMLNVDPTSRIILKGIWKGWIQTAVICYHMHMNMHCFAFCIKAVHSFRILSKQHTRTQRWFTPVHCGVLKCTKWRKGVSVKINSTATICTFLCIIMHCSKTQIWLNPKLFSFVCSLILWQIKTPKLN